jgi:CelD/BcsL family acetyltransferase involved in cellulose biosynthesis
VRKKAEAKPERKKVVLVSKRTGEVIPPAAAGIAALPKVREAAPQINAAWDAETLLNNLSIKQARALYDELRKIFGG